MMMKQVIEKIENAILYPIAGGHLTVERVTSPSQKGHKELTS